jgi:CHAT domain-containing protein
MSAFYTLLTPGDLAKSQALREAQIALITGNLQSKSNNITAAKTNFHHPYDWKRVVMTSS